MNYTRKGERERETISKWVVWVFVSGRILHFLSGLFFFVDIFACRSLDVYNAITSYVVLLHSTNFLLYASKVVPEHSF